MNIGIRHVPTKFALETRFEVPIPCVPFRGAPEQELEQLKNRLLRQLLLETPNPALHEPLQRAATAAAALAWLTPYPLLVLPLLLEEKAQTVRRQLEQQKRIRQRSSLLLPQAA
jgi:hypothetical protein